MPSPKIVIAGALGRMGRMVGQACEEASLEIIGGTEVPALLKEEWKAGGKAVPLAGDVSQVLQPGCVLIDFTQPESTLKNIRVAVDAQAKVVIGTTGFSEEEKKQIQKASEQTAVVFSPNMSVGVNVLFKVTELVSRVLGPEYDAEIVEAHPRYKKDAPSGTALGLAEAIGRGRRIDAHKALVHGRSGMTGERASGAIGMHALRGGKIVGDHNVWFTGDDERLELKHVAQDRRVFAQGAVRAAKFLADQSRGLFTMFDVLGLADL